MAGTISGSIVQRSFVGIDAPNILHIATAPMNELAFDPDNFEESLSSILGTPKELILKAETYATAIDQYRSSYLRRGAERPAPFDFNPLFIEGSKGTEYTMFADFVLSATSPLKQFSPPFSYYGPYGYWDDLGPRVPVELFAITLDLLSARHPLVDPNFRTSRQKYASDLLNYEIPFGQSPAIKTDSLLNLLETSKKFCVAPLVLGGAQAVNQLAQGHYLAALQCTGTAGVMTLMLIGTVSVGAIMVQRAAQMRVKPYDGGKRGGGVPQPQPIPQPGSSGGVVAVPIDYVPPVSAQSVQSVTPSIAARSLRAKRKNRSDPEASGGQVEG